VYITYYKGAGAASFGSYTRGLELFLKAKNLRCGTWETGEGIDRDLVKKIEGFGEIQH
jgi:hypothetical protein